MPVGGGVVSPLYGFCKCTLSHNACVSFRYTVVRHNQPKYNKPGNPACGRVGVWACGRVGVWACGRVCGRACVRACVRARVWLYVNV